MPAIREVNRKAFGREEEAWLVDELRDGDYARLSLVAEEARRIIGHILFSEAAIRAEGGDTEALALGPVAVTPELQGQGIGAALVSEGLDRCASMGSCVIVLLGHPDYYPRFGFSAELARGLSSPYSGDAFMALELVPGTLSGVSGEFEFAPPFGALS